MSEYITDHGKLLDFMRRIGELENGRRNSGFPRWASAVTFQKLRDQIITTGKELDQQYKHVEE